MVTFAAGKSRPPGKFYRPELDLLRFGAFLLVFVHHAPTSKFRVLAEAGGAGMGIFFLLSAFLIGSLLLKEREKTGTVHLKLFYLRRVLRIWPLYFLAVAIGLVVSALSPVPGYKIAPGALPYLLLLAANIFVAHHGWLLGVIRPLWSLSIEEQFYVVVPTLAKVSGRRALLAVSLVAFVAAYAALWWLGVRGAIPQYQVWVNTFVQAQFFAAGTLLALWLEGRAWNLPWVARLGLLAVGAAAITAMARVAPLSSLEVLGPGKLMVGYLCTLLGSAAIFLALFQYPGRIPAGLLYLGQISYGLYVFHDMVIRGLTYPSGNPPVVFGVHTSGMEVAGAALLITIGLAATSYHFYERPLMRLKERFAVVKSGAEAPT